MEVVNRPPRRDEIWLVTPESTPRSQTGERPRLHRVFVGTSRLCFLHLLFWPDVVLGMGNAHQPLIEPADNVIQALDAVPRLARTREFVRLSRKDNHCGGPLQELERAEQ